MSMNTDAIVGGMNSVEALTMARKCLVKLDAEQLDLLLSEISQRVDEVTEDKQDEPKEEQ